MTRSLEAPRIATATPAMRICIVTTAHLCNNPRVVKEADALHEAGHDVRVIGYDRWPEWAELDREMMVNRGWRFVPVRIRPEGMGRAAWMMRGILGQAASRAYSKGLRIGPVRDLAMNKYSALMTAAATREPADLVIAHHAHALPAAAAAAKQLGSRFGFDAEDLHSGEYAGAAASSVQRRLVIDVEREYLPRCDVLTASSPPIADELSRLYQVKKPAVILNTFPSTDADAGTPGTTDRDGDAPSLYWFSQMVGANRGIEDILEAMALLETPVQLFLRGTLDTSFAPQLEALIRRYGLEDRVRIMPRVPPSQLVADASQHDIGLALEQPLQPNRDLAITNKLFIYMLAGLALAASDTRGQRFILEQAPNAGVLYTPGDPAQLAAALEPLVTNPDRLRAARRAAREAGRTRFNWEHERERLVQHLTGAPYSRARSAAATSEIARAHV